jgi:light-regulated signal transduction histidine kinase (bacteriophytochrome)
MRQYFERIFGMFQRLHGREEFSGMGMGLCDADWLPIRSPVHGR